MKLIAILVLTFCAFSAFALSNEEGDSDFLSRQRRQGPPSARIAIKGDTGLYLSRINRGKNINPIEVAKSTIDRHCIFDAIDHGKNVFAFKASNGKFLCRIFRNNIQGIEASKSSIDSTCLFTLSGHSPGKLVTIRADNGKYWSRIDRGQENPVEAAKSSPDVYSRFKFENL